ncbi:MAG: 5'-3' exonuclease [Verrucomicrobiae bacterium]|nr:5'-3' exonuclease [Verrucomicrobiae bacterium]
MLLVVDFLNLAYRSFHAIPRLTNARGIPTNAIHGFLNSVNRWLADLQPSRLAIVMDGEPKRRLARLPQYKANRPPTPPDLTVQLDRLTELFAPLGWPVLREAEEEADDLGAALALKASAAGEEARIASNDKDFLQVVGDRIKVLRGSAKETVTADAVWVRARWGIAPEQVADFLALLGDQVDNIPGVPGVGEKTASELLRRFGDLDRLAASVSEIERPALQKNLREHLSIAFRNRDLVRLKTDLPLPSLDDFGLRPPEDPSLLTLLADLDLKSLHARYAKEMAARSAPRQGMLF